MQTAPGKFEEIRTYVRGLYGRITNAKPSDVEYWQRILTLESKCKDTLVAHLQFPAIDKQVPLPQLRATVSENGQTFYKAQDGKAEYSVTDLTEEQKIQVRSLRCNALVVSTTKPCRIRPGMGDGVLSVETNPEHQEILFILELVPGDAADLLRVVTSTNTTSFIAEVPDYWAQVLHGVGFVDATATKKPEASAGLQYLILPAGESGKQVVIFPQERDPLLWGSVGNVDDIKNFSLASYDDAVKLHDRMVAWRSNWKQMLISAGENQRIARLAADKNGLDVADKQIREIHQVAKIFEPTFRARLSEFMRTLPASATPPVLRQQLNEWLNESIKMESNSNLWPITNTPGSITSLSSTSLITTPSQPEITVAPSQVQAIIDDFTEKRKAFEVKEVEAKKVIQKEIEQSYANADAKHKALVDITTHLQSLGQEDRYRGQVRQARECFHAALSATAESQVETRTSAELATVRDILVLNNSCLDRYLNTFRVYEKEATSRFKTTEQMNAQQKMIAMQTIARSADDAIREAKNFIAQPGFYDPEGTYKAILVDMESKRQALGALIATQDLDIALAEVERRQAEAEALRDAIVKQMIDITTAARDDLPSVLLMQQLKGSQVDLVAAKRRANESASLAAEHQRQAELSQRAQDVLLHRAQFTASPYRTVGAQRSNLDEVENNLIESTRLKLKILIGNLDAAIQTNNASNNVHTLVGALERFEKNITNLTTRTERLSDLLEEAKAAKMRATEMLNKPPIEEEEDQEEDEGDIPSEEEEIDVVAALKDAVENEDIDDLEVLIDDVEEEELAVGRKLPGASKWLKAARKLLE